MKIKDAVKVLNLTGEITPEKVKKAYRQAAMSFHPDRNPTGAEMMKIINAAYEALKGFSGMTSEEESSDETSQNYSAAVNRALNAIIHLVDLDIEICGAWIWVSGNTYAHKKELKQAGFHYASQKKRWYFRPEDWKSSSRASFDMDEIRGKYGSQISARKRRPSLSTRGAALRGRS